MNLGGAALAINPLAVLAAAVLTFVIGGIWYSSLLFERPWRGLIGVSDAQFTQASQPRIFGLSFVAALVMSINLALFLGGPSVDVVFGATAGLLAGVGWVAAAMATTYLFERRSLRLWAIDAGYHVVALTAMGALLGAWR
jgi:hypothetical protein